MKRIIKWESQHLEINTLSGKLQEPEFEEEEEIYDDECDDDMMSKMPVQNIMSTQFGFWKVDDTMNPYKQFKMWMGHTNFSITSEIVSIIQNIPGVEVLQVMTRYRFIVGVAELFDIRNVRTTIEEQLQCHKGEDCVITDQQLLEQVHELKKQLSVFDMWAIYVFPNGNIDYTTSDSDDFKQQLHLYKQAVDYSSGILIESENE